MRPSRLTDRRQTWCSCVSCLMGPWKGSAPSTASWPRAAMSGGRLRDRSLCTTGVHTEAGKVNNRSRAATRSAGPVTGCALVAVLQPPALGTSFLASTRQPNPKIVQPRDVAPPPPTVAFNA